MVDQLNAAFFLLRERLTGTLTPRWELPRVKGLTGCTGRSFSSFFFCLYQAKWLRRGRMPSHPSVDSTYQACTLTLPYRPPSQKPPQEPQSRRQVQQQVQQSQWHYCHAHDEKGVLGRAQKFGRSRFGCPPDYPRVHVTPVTANCLARNIKREHRRDYLLFIACWL
jgi:hypothetical protein